MSEQHSHDEDDHDHDQVDVVRLWVEEGDLHCDLAPPDLFEEPSTWGEVIAELARNVATGLQEKSGNDPAETIRVIREAFLKDLEEFK